MYWFATSDDHWPWNTFNVIVEIAFEQGTLGVSIFVLLTEGLVLRLWRQQSEGVAGAGIWLASIVGFLVPAFFDAVIDDPRMRLLFLLLLTLPFFNTRVRVR